MVLCEVVVDLVEPEQEARFRELMQAHHYLGGLPKIGETLWYVAHLNGAWLALAVFSAAALKCRARDAWVGWDFRCQYGRLHLVSNNTRLLLLPGPRHHNLGSRVLGLCARRIVRDWPTRFGHPLVLLETFVDPARFHGTVYRAANWRMVGHTRGFRRRGGGYDETSTPKRVFLYPLTGDVRQQLSGARLDPTLHKGVPKTMLGVDPNSWTPDPLGRRYPPCRDQDRRTRRSSGARWLSWCEPDGVRKSCHESSSRRRRRSATGSCKASVTRGVAGMGQAPRSERSCVAFAERIVGCAKNEISWQKPRPGLLGGPYRGGLPVHESESGRVSNRHDGPSARSLPERVLRVAHP